MANPIIVYARPHEWTIAWSGGAATGYGTDNLKDYDPTTVSRSAVKTDDLTLNIDLTAAAAIDAAVCHTHNFDELGASETADVYLEGATAADYGTGLEVAVAGTFGVDGADALFPFDALTKRYWRLRYARTPPGSDFLTYPEIGNLYLGKKLEFPYGVEYPAKLADPQFQTSRERSLSGIMRTSQQVAGSRRFEIAFKLFSDAFRLEFLIFMETVRGGLYPFYFSPDGGTTLYYVRNIADYNPATRMRYNLNSVETLVMETVVADVD